MRWSIHTERLEAPRNSVPPTAQRVLSAAWAGEKALATSIAEIVEALAHGGVDARDTVTVVACRPAQATAITSALTRLGAHHSVAFDQGPYTAPARMHPGFGPCLAFQVAIGPPCSRRCSPGCRCGRFLLIAYLHFASPGHRHGSSNGTRPVFEAVVLEHSLLSAAHRTDDSYGPTRLAPLIDAVRGHTTAHARETPPSRSLRLLTDRSFTAALLLGAGSVPAPRGPGHTVRRLLRQAATELVRCGSTPDRLPWLVGEADRLVRVPLGLHPLTPHRLVLVQREMDAFSGVLDSGYNHFLRGLRPDQSPEDRALNLWRLRSVHGVPLPIALAWYRERSLLVSLHRYAAADFAARFGTGHPTRL